MTLDAGSFPDIFDAIFQKAEYGSLLALRAASRNLRTRVDKRLVEHILVFENGRIASRRGPNGQIPCINWADDSELLNAVRIIDYHTGGGLVGQSLGFIPGKGSRLAESNWYERVRDHRFRFRGSSYTPTPVLRAWCDDSPPRTVADIIVVGHQNYCLLDGTQTRVMLLSFPWRLPLYFHRLSSRRERPVVPTKKVVFRPRVNSYLLNDSSHSVEFAATAITKLFGTSQFPDQLQIVFVDLVRTECDEEPETTSPTAEQVLQVAAGRVVSTRHVALVQSNVSFMTKAEYRASIGEEAFALEEDDHDFRFTSEDAY